jgi:CheY-like chemotaxis protein
MRVLVVDDNHFQLRVVKASLNRSGVELDAAVHGKEAVDLVAKRLERPSREDAAPTSSSLYDVILMDSMMPVMDGCAATIEIRKLEKTFRASLPPALTSAGGAFEREMVIIGLSAEAGPEYEAGARAAGMDGALGKPCRPDALRDALRQVNEGTFNSWKASSKRGTLHF